MSKKLYPDQDINDILESEEQEFFKGGPGSGKKGHETPRRGPDGKLTAEYKASKIAEIEANIKRNRLKATNHMSHALANRKIGTDNSPAALGIHAAGNESTKKSDDEIFLKSFEDFLEDEYLEKGGEGSGQKGHTTAKEALSARLSAKGIPKEKHYLYTDKKYKRATSIGVDALGNDLRPGEESKRAYAGQPMTRDHQAQEKRKAELKGKK